MPFLFVERNFAVQDMGPLDRYRPRDAYRTQQSTLPTALAKGDQLLWLSNASGDLHRALTVYRQPL
ncbi:hypothetical protein BN126310252 [Stenotrophomonas thermophila]|nr:hypothetical protein BN126310252 [Stenotrophomonas maltophilia]